MVMAAPKVVLQQSIAVTCSLLCTNPTQTFSHLPSRTKLSPVQEVSNLDKVILLEASGSKGWGANSHPTRNDGRLVPWDAVLVDGDGGQVKHTLRPGTVNT